MRTVRPGNCSCMERIDGGQDIHLYKIFNFGYGCTVTRRCQQEIWIWLQICILWHQPNQVRSVISRRMTRADRKKQQSRHRLDIVESILQKTFDSKQYLAGTWASLWLKHQFLFKKITNVGPPRKVLHIPNWSFNGSWNLGKPAKNDYLFCL